MREAHRLRSYLNDFASVTMIVASAAIVWFLVTWREPRAAAGPEAVEDIAAAGLTVALGDALVTRGAGRYVSTNAPVLSLLSSAYGVPPEAILNAPRWVRTELFDVEAVDLDAPSGFDRARHQHMMRRLLAERFNAVIREVSTRQGGYALALARGDGRLGPELKPSDAQCEAAPEPAGAGASEPRARAGLADSDCVIRDDGQGTVTATGVSFDFLVRAIRRALPPGTVVIDRTDLEGRYDFQLMYAPERGPTPLSPAEPATTPSLPERPSIFTAVADQLGLKLDPEEVPQAAIYIERIERPTPN